MFKKTLLFILAVAVQTAIVAMVPARKIYTLNTGQLITIRTAPVDPYDFLSGYHVILGYEIARPSQDDSVAEGKTVYVVLTEAADRVWQTHSAYQHWPDSIPDGAVVLKGIKKDWRGVQYGIETFFIPEKDRGVIEDDLRKNAGKALADIKVDRFGRAALVRLRIEDRVYEY